MALPLPAFFDPESAGRVFRVPYQQRAEDARAFALAHGVTPAIEDRRRVAVLLIDVQNTFCLPEFELFVGGRSGRGAVDDSARLCAFLYANLGRITEVVATLDTHTSTQIFHPVFWVDGQGRHPAPHTVIRRADVESGAWRPNPRLAPLLVSTIPTREGDTGPDPAPPPADAILDTWARHYVCRLDEGGKFPLIVWPYHSMLGGIGHALVSAVEEAVFFHSIARAAPTRFEIKGRNPLTESYSVLRPEVAEDASGRPVAEANRALVEHLLGFDALVVAGQAKSHCVAWTVEDLLSEIQAREAALARRVFLLDDCSSPVVVPGALDFTEAAEAAYARFAAAGMHRVLSTQPIESWPRPG